MANEYEPLHIRTTANVLHAADMTTTDLYPAMAIISKIDLRPIRERTKSQKIWHFMDKYFMIIGLVIVIVVAYQWPDGGHYDGPLHPEITSSWIATILLFFFIGLGIKIKYLRRACLFWQLNLFCHFVIFIYFPLIGLAIKWISTLSEDMVSDEMSTLLDGVIILCCLPATVASAVVFTSNANGNEAATAINCMLSNLIGIFITPALILIIVRNTGKIDPAGIFRKLSLRLIAPVFVAQLIRIAVGRKVRRKIKKAKPYIRKINEVALLYIVYCSMSESFYDGIKAKWKDIASITGIMILLHGHIYFVMWYIASVFRCCIKGDPNASQFMAFTVFDRIAILYCCSSKTISVGIPLIETIYEDNPNLGMYLIPLLLYKPISLIVGTLLVNPFRKLVGKAANESFTVSTNLAPTTPEKPAHDLYGDLYGASVPFMNYLQFGHIEFVDEKKDNDLYS